MKSLTIRNLDDSLDAAIRERAKKEGLSLNRTVKMLLRSALDLDPHDSGDRKADFTEFCGVWSEADAVEFEKNTKDLRKVSPRDWQ